MSEWVSLASLQCTVYTDLYCIDFTVQCSLYCTLLQYSVKWPRKHEVSTVVTLKLVLFPTFSLNPPNVIGSRIKTLKCRFNWVFLKGRTNLVITGVQFLNSKPVRRVNADTILKRIQHTVINARIKPTLNMAKFRVADPIANWPIVVQAGCNSKLMEQNHQFLHKLIIHLFK